jgi:lysophospholipase L1-like esterase
VHSALPATRVNYISIKPSPSRANLLPAITEANGLIRSALAAVPNTGFIDIYTPMLGTDGQPDPALFLPDMLHMKPSGYALWTRAIAPSVSCPK